MNKFWKWLANSPYASIIKIAVGGALAAVLATITNADGTPASNALIVVLGAALIPWVLHLINPVSRMQYLTYKMSNRPVPVVVLTKKAAKKAQKKAPSKDAPMVKVGI